MAASALDGTAQKQPISGCRAMAVLPFVCPGLSPQPVTNASPAWTASTCPRTRCNADDRSWPRLQLTVTESIFINWKVPTGENAPNQTKSV